MSSEEIVWESGICGMYVAHQDRVYDLRADEDGRWWVSTYYGLSRADGKESNLESAKKRAEEILQALLRPIYETSDQEQVTCETSSGPVSS